MSVAGGLGVGGAALIACGVAWSLVGSPRRSLIVQVAGMAVVGGTGALVLGGARPVGARFRGGLSPAFGIDRLSGFFLLVLGVIAVPALWYARDALRGTPRAGVTAGLSGGFCLALVGLVSARDLTSFLGFWELMTLLPAALILVGRQDGRARRDVFAYVAITHLGGVGVWASLLVLAAHGAVGGVPLHGEGLPRSSRWPRCSALAPRRARCPCTRGCRAPIRWHPRTCRR